MTPTVSRGAHPLDEDREATARREKMRSRALSKQVLDALDELGNLVLSSDAEHENALHELVSLGNEISRRVAILWTEPRPRRVLRQMSSQHSFPTTFSSEDESEIVASVQRQISAPDFELNFRRELIAERMPVKRGQGPGKPPAKDRLREWILAFVRAVSFESPVDLILAARFEDHERGFEHWEKFRGDRTAPLPIYLETEKFLASYEDWATRFPDVHRALMAPPRAAKLWAEEFVEFVRTTMPQEVLRPGGMFFELTRARVRSIEKSQTKRPGASFDTDPEKALWRSFRVIAEKRFEGVLVP